MNAEIAVVVCVTVSVFLASSTQIRVGERIMHAHAGSHWAAFE